MAQIETLQELREAVRRASKSETAFGLLNARLLILIGVNLREISQKQNHDAMLIKRTTEALSRMGIRLEIEGQ